MPAVSTSHNYNGNMPWDTHGNGPDPGSYNKPDHTPANGYDNNTPSANPINAPGGPDYTSWNWEQVLNGVLGLKLPDRLSIKGLRWTASDGSYEKGTLYTIFSFSGTDSEGDNAFFVYLNPDLQDAGGPWDEYYNTPKNQIWQVFSSSPPNYTTIAIDPRTFGTAAVALGAVENMYLNAKDFFYNTASNLNSEASQFQGQAGEAFYEIIQNLYTAASKAYDQMAGNPDYLGSHPNSYGGRFAKGNLDSGEFVMGIWQTIGAWEERLDHTPIGAIYQAILDAGIVQHAPGGGYIIPNAKNVNQFGNLLSDYAWTQVETVAKQLWLNAIQETLDTSARSLINMLSVSYLDTAGLIQAVNQPALNPIGSSGGPNTNDLNSGGGLNGIGDLGLNGLGDGLNGLGNGLGDLGNGLNGLGDGLLGLGGGLNGFGGGLNGLGGGLNGFGGGLNGLGGSGNVLAGINGSGGLNGPGGLNGLGGGLLGGLNTSGNPPVNQLRNALADTNATRQALERALALAPSSGPLHNELLKALADNGAAQAALQGALAGTMPFGTALQTALTDNGKAQALVNRALASGQVPKTGPLRSALNQASGDLGHTKKALLGTLGSAVPGGDFVHAALADNSKLTSLLRHALASGQVPSTGPLHDTLQAALADAGKARRALDQALASGGTPSTNAIQQALVDNRTAQQELTKAFASGQIPSTGPLRGDLQTALADSRSMSSALRQALTSASVPAEPFPGLPGLGLPATLGGPSVAGLHGLPPLVGGGGGGAPGFAGGAGHAGHAGLGGAAGPAASTGLSPLGQPAAPVSSGRFVAPPGALAAGAGAPGTQGTGAVPFFPPMAGMGMGGGGGQQGNQERERTTWLAEDEDVWGTTPAVGPASIGRDLVDLDDEPDSYDDYAESATGSRRSQYRQGAY